MTVSWLLSRFPSRSGPRSAAPFVRPRPNSIPIARRTLFGSASAGAAAATASGSAAFLPHISDSLLPIILGIILYARRQQEDEATSDQLQLSGPWTVQESSKGMAVFATRDIKRGETLLSENPLLVWDIDADAAATKKLVARLSSEARKQFFSLANALPNSNELDPELGVRGTNGFNVQLPPLPRDVATGHELQAFTQTGSPSHATMIFPRVARLNHSCLPSQHHSRNPASCTAER